MKNFDIFVMPSTENSETFGVAAIEAQAMEIPVVASKIGGIPEAMLDGTTGILVEPKNVEQLADAMIRLIENPEDRKRMGKAGRQFVLNNYNLEENVGLFESLYKSMSNI
jgi:glycosyltransferase involved in cell wall biosynthesis